jgi:primosomal protein N' (replication factor Y)
MLIALVALSEALRSFDKLYSYKLRLEDYNKAVPGMRVLVPFGRKNRLSSAWVIDLINEDTKMELKEIHQFVDNEPLLSSEMIKLAKWMKNRYFCTWGDAIRIMLPAGINLKRTEIIKLSDNLKKNDTFMDTDKLPLTEAQELLLENLYKKSKGIEKEKIKDYGMTEKELEELIQMNLAEISEIFGQKVNEKIVKAVRPLITKEELNQLIEEGKVRSIYHIRIMDLLFTEDICTLQDLLLIPGVSRATIKNIEKKGWVSLFDMETERDPFENIVEDNTEPPILTDEQDNVIRNTLPLLDENKLNEVLIHGITGSGKTEIYLKLIENVLNKGKKAIVLVPEISLTPQITSRFTGRFGSRIAILHSRLSQGERYDQWRKIKKGEVDVVIGARSAVFAPVENLGIIIIDEEHELSYKSESTPKYDARQVARARCNINGALLIMGSATPSLESYYRAKKGKMTFQSLKSRPNEYQLPTVETVDLREELKNGNRSPISKRLEEELVKNKEKGEQSIIFLNRRGYATFLLCRNCGFVLKCPHCSISLRVHTHDKQVMCHYCGYSQPIPQSCQECGSLDIKAFGTGTQRIENELLKHPAGFKIIRMDLDTTMGKHRHQKLLQSFKNREADILLGTQMVAKGHDIPNVTLVGILAADASLFTADFRSSERTFQLITQASGRAGRGERPGRVILQAYNIDDYAIQTAVMQDYEAFYKKEILIRKKLFAPPFCHIVHIIVSGENADGAKNSIKKLQTIIFERYNNEKFFVMSQVAPAPVFIIKNKTRWSLVIKIPSVKKAVKLVNEALDIFQKIRVKGTDISVDIDPATML